MSNFFCSNFEPNLNFWIFLLFSWNWWYKTFLWRNDTLGFDTQLHDIQHQTKNGGTLSNVIEQHLLDTNEGKQLS